MMSLYELGYLQAYSSVDTMVAIWIVNMVTGARQLAGMLRKQTDCRCGPRGKCTWWPPLSFPRWSIENIAQR